MRPKEVFYVYLRSNDVQKRFKMRMRFEEMEQFIEDNANDFRHHGIECDITDMLDRLVASNNYSSKNLDLWEVCH